MNEYDEVYVISDIHLGGKNDSLGNFQIFKYGERLGAFIDEVASARPGDQVALILNGDVFDSLAEDDVAGYVALNEQEATRFISRIYEDTSFAPVWRALETFVGTPGRRLVFVVGNHDIELALPIVQTILSDKLTGGQTDQSHRVQFATSGSGYSCTVGGARVFCTHGNETDAFNWVDYNSLGQLANAMNAGRSVSADDWKPNAGTRLVVDVMNIVKRKYPFVDILKPEASAVAAVLLAIDRDTFSRIDLTDGIPVLRKMRSGRKVVSNLLGDDLDSDSADQSVTAERFLDQILGEELKQSMGGSGKSEDELLGRSISDPNFGRQEMSDTSGKVETLGWGDVIAGRIGLLSQSEGLRRALLDWIGNEKEFDVDHEDDTFNAFKERIGPGISFAITGHTHKARALRLPTSGYYFNTGTWIRTLRFTHAALKDRKYFEETVWPELKETTLDRLDSFRIKGDNGKDQPLLDDRTHAVRISRQHDTVSGELLHIRDRKSGGVTMKREKGTQPFTVASS